MEIHAPHSAVRSLKEFGTHILIVTVGILIALGLEGIRETVHEKHLVRDTQENFRVEISENRSKLQREIQNLEETRKAIDRAVANVMANKRTKDGSSPIAAIKPSFYALAARSWQTALSTGALGHMTTTEAAKYAEASQATLSYTAYQEKTISVYFEIEALGSQGSMSAEEKKKLGYELRLLAQHEAVLGNLARQLLADYDAALAMKA